MEKLRLIAVLAMVKVSSDSSQVVYTGSVSEQFVIALLSPLKCLVIFKVPNSVAGDWRHVS